MKILAIDTESNAVDLLMRAQAYGHEVMMWDKARKNGSERRAGEGLIPKLRDFDALRKRWIGWADLIYYPQNDAYLELIEPYRKIGYPVYGANVEACKWESDRAEGQRIMKECGLKIIPSKEFNDYDAAIKFVEKGGNYLVSKPSGEADKSLSFVADNAAQLVATLEDWSRKPKFVADAKACGFIIQEKKSGCEMGVGGFIGPNGWIGMWEENWENKKFMAGDIGPNTGEQGTVMRYVKKSKLADLVLKPLTDKLLAVGYCGCVDVNCIITDDGTPWPLEFTMRDGWPARRNSQALIQNADPCQWMLDLVNGEDTIELIDGLICVSIVVTIPPYPHKEGGDDVDGKPIYGYDKNHVHLCDVRLGENVPVPAGDGVVHIPSLVTAGEYVAVICGTGKTVSGARRSALAATEKFKVKHKQYRNEIGSKLAKQLPDIQKHGYATNLEV